MTMKKNPVAKALRSERFKQRKVKPKKGKGSYQRTKGSKADQTAGDSDSKSAARE